MIISGYYTDSQGTPTGGLTPTITIENVTDGIVAVNGQSMVETNITGVYKFDYRRIDPNKQYVMMIDYGTSENRYGFGEIIQNQGVAGGGGGGGMTTVTKEVRPEWVESILEKKLQEIKIPEQKEIDFSQLLDTIEKNKPKPDLFLLTKVNDLEKKFSESMEKTNAMVDNINKFIEGIKKDEEEDKKEKEKKKMEIVRELKKIEEAIKKEAEDKRKEDEAETLEILKELELITPKKKRKLKSVTK